VLQVVIPVSTAIQPIASHVIPRALNVMVRAHGPNVPNAMLLPFTMP